MTMKKSRAPVAVDEWPRQQMDEASHYAFPAGLYDLPDDYTGIAEAKVRARAMELYGKPGAEPATRRERQAISQRAGA